MIGGVILILIIMFLKLVLSTETNVDSTSEKKIVKKSFTTSLGGLILDKRQEKLEKLAKSYSEDFAEENLEYDFQYLFNPIISDDSFKLIKLVEKQDSLLVDEYYELIIESYGDIGYIPYENTHLIKEILNKDIDLVKLHIKGGEYRRYSRKEDRLYKGKIHYIAELEIIYSELIE